MTRGLLGSWFIAGFEGSTHRRSDGRRLDLVAATQHDRFAAQDFARIRRLGIRAARESLRWHLVETQPGRYRFDVERRRIEAAQAHRITVVWDLCHFGWPDHVDPFATDFADRYASWSAAVARLLARESDPPHWFAPQNEISFLAWAGPVAGAMNPHVVGAGGQLKRQLVRAAIHAIDAIRAELPAARFLHPEPLINVAADPERPHERHHAVQASEAQFEAWDMMAGRLFPELGGSEGHLDVLGANYYPDNQWSVDGATLPAGHPDRVRLSTLMADLHGRYGREIIISETGAEDEARGPWIREVSAEVDDARRRGVPLGGICLYPIVNHPGWEDDRHCHNGIWDYPGPKGGRRAHRPLLRHVLAAAADRRRVSRSGSRSGAGRASRSPSRASRPASHR